MLNIYQVFASIITLDLKTFFNVVNTLILVSKQKNENKEII